MQLNPGEAGHLELVHPVNGCQSFRQGHCLELGFEPAAMPNCFEAQSAAVRGEGRGGGGGEEGYVERVQREMAEVEREKGTVG